MYENVVKKCKELFIMDKTRPSIHSHVQDPSVLIQARPSEYTICWHKRD